MIYIVNHTTGGYYVENWTSYHRTRAEAEAEYNKCCTRVGIDPVIISIIELNPETLHAETVQTWSGNEDDLEDELNEDEDYTGHVGIPDGYDPSQDAN